MYPISLHETEVLHNLIPSWFVRNQDIFFLVNSPLTHHSYDINSIPNLSTCTNLLTNYLGLLGPQFSKEDCCCFLRLLSLNYCVYTWCIYICISVYKHWFPYFQDLYFILLSSAIDPKRTRKWVWAQTTHDICKNESNRTYDRFT